MVALVASALIFIFAFYLLKKQPLSKRTRVSALWDIGVGVVFMMGVVFYLTSTYVMQQIVEDDLAKQPCGEDSPQGRCYSLNLQLCESLWEKATKSCQDEMAEFLKAHPTSLVGPAANQCKARQMDKAIRFNRINADTPYCKAYFSFIDNQK